MALVPRILELLRANGLDDVSLFLGGIIPDEDVPALKAMGVAGIFGPGTSTEAVVAAVAGAVRGSQAH
jgi:methylmalonyl-CoA mutase C-terminal domain/subunit